MKSRDQQPGACKNTLAAEVFLQKGRGEGEGERREGGGERGGKGEKREGGGGRGGKGEGGEEGRGSGRGGKEEGGREGEKGGGGRRERVCGYRDGIEGEGRVMPCMQGPFLLCFLSDLLSQDGFCWFSEMPGASSYVPFLQQCVCS